MDKRAIIFLCVLIGLPIGGIGLLCDGIIKNNIGQISGGAISCIVAIVLWAIVIYFIKKKPQDEQKQKQPLTPEEKEKRNVEFIRKHFKLFLVLTIISALLFGASITLLVVFVENEYSFLIGIPLFISMFAFIALFTVCLYAKGGSKKNKTVCEKVSKTIDTEENDSDIHFEKSETVVTETMTEQEQRNAEAMRQMQKEAQQRKVEQERKQREWYWEQQRKEREEQERREREKREREQISIKYFNEHKHALIEKYSEVVFNFIEKLTDSYPHIFLRMFNNMETLQSSILVKPYENASQLLKTKILNDGLEFTESDNAEANKKIQELTNFFIQGLKKRIVESGDYNDEFTFSALLYCIVRNNVIKYYRNEYIETYGYESLDELCDHIANPFEQDKTNIKVLDDVLTISRFMSNNAISQFVYYYICENNIELPFVDTYKKIVLDMKQIFERKKKEKLENDLFGKPKKQTVTENDTPNTLSPIDRIDRMTGEQFEIFMEDYFRKQGFKVERTPLSGDYGIDLIIENDFSKIGVQAKCYSNKVTASAVQEVVTGLRHYGLSGGMVVTNNYFQPAAIQLAKDNGITLWNRDKLIEKLKY